MDKYKSGPEANTTARVLTRFFSYVAGYLVLHWATYVFVFAEFRVTPWNPETGLSFLLAYLWGPVTWPALFIANLLGEFATNTTSDLSGMMLRSSLYATAYTIFGTIFKTWTSADRLGSLSQIIKLLVVAALAAFLFGALLVLGISWLVRMPSPRIVSAIITSATGDMVGILSIVPLHFAWAAAPFWRAFEWRSLIPLTISVLGIGAACFIVFGLDSTDEFKFFYLIFLPVVALSLLYGLVGAALGVFASDLMMMAMIYIRDVAPGTATELQILMITLSATGLLLGSVVSERRRLSMELIESHQRLSDAQTRLLHGSRVMLINEMASAIAHEINQPLSAIRNFCRAIQRLLPGEQVDRKRLETLVGSAVEQVDAASAIINDTRRFVRRETPAEARASLVDSVAICARLFQQEMVKSKIGFKTDVSPGIWVGIQAVKLQQVLLNLLRNSIESVAETGGEIEVTARRSGDGRILVTVKDTGMGISEEVRADLFKPFMTTKEHGLGLGLSLSRTIVNDHGGELWCEKSIPGDTSICFILREETTS
jgi:two-component system, LuxR family, sensor kinase FixL